MISKAEKPSLVDNRPDNRSESKAFQELEKAGYLTHLSSYAGESGRLLDLKVLLKKRSEMAEDNGILIKVPRIVPLLDSLFRHYLEHGRQFDPQLEAQLLQIIEEQMKLSETGQLSVRRAYWDTEKSILLGNMRLNGLPADPEQVLAAIKEMYEKEPIKEGWDKNPAITVDLMLQEFTNPEYQIENGKLVGGNVPYGGAAWFDPSQASVFVQVTCGDNRSITMHEDLSEKFRLSVDNGNGVRIVERQTLNYRPVMYLDRGNKMISVDLPREKQVNFTPISDLYLAVLGQVAYEVYKKTGKPIKIEFSAGRKGVYINELVPIELQKTEVKVEPFDITSRIYASIGTMADVYALRDHHPKQLDYPPLIYLQPQVLEDTANLRNILAELNKIQEKKTKMGTPPFVYLAATGITSHAFETMTMELGLTVYSAQAEQEFKEGDRARLIRTEDNEVTVYNLTLAGSEKVRYIQQYPEKSRPSEIGNKAHSILLLQEMKFATPPAYVLTEDFFRDFLTVNEANDIWFTLGQCKNVSELKQKFAQLQEIHKMPSEWARLEKMLTRNFGEGLSQARFAVRSSGIIEDLETRQFAGTFYTALNVEPEKLAEEVLKVMRSPFTEAIAQSIWQEEPTTGREILNNLSMPVLIQPLVDAKWSGTVFHWDTTTADKNPRVIVIEAEPGVGGVVGSENRGTRLTIKFDSYTKKLLSAMVTSGSHQVKLDSLEDLVKEGVDFPVEEILALRESAIVIKNQMGKPHDTEWAYGSLNSHPNQMWYLQTRPSQIK